MKLQILFRENDCYYLFTVLVQFTASDFLKKLELYFTEFITKRTQH